MTWEPRSIDEQILCLARLTGASDAFVGEVRALFLRRGIALDSDAGPYLSALEDAFLREERTRVQVVPAARAAAAEAAARPATPRAAAVVLPHQRESWPHVPGPEEIQ